MQDWSRSKVSGGATGEHCSLDNRKHRSAMSRPLKSDENLLREYEKLDVL